MSSRLVDTSLSILLLLNAQKLHVNAIIKETSSDRTHVIETIKKLTKRKIVDVTTNPRHKEMKVMQLTETGSEIVTFYDSADQCSKHLALFAKAMAEHFPLPAGSFDQILRNKLRTRNWTENEIHFYDKILRQAEEFALDSTFFFVTATSTRYIVLLSKYHQNQLATDILTKIFVNAINRHFTAILPTFSSLIRSLQFKHDVVDQISSQLHRPIIQYVAKYSQDAQKIDNRFLETEAKSIVDAIYAIIEPSENRNLLSTSITNLRRMRPLKNV